MNTSSGSDQMDLFLFYFFFIFRVALNQKFNKTRVEMSESSFHIKQSYDTHLQMNLYFVKLSLLALTKIKDSLINMEMVKS